MAAARENARREIIDNENGDIREDDVEVALPEVHIAPHREPNFAFDMFGGGMAQRLDAARANGRANALLPNNIVIPGGPLPENFGALMARAPFGLEPLDFEAFRYLNAANQGADNPRLQEVRERFLRLQALRRARLDLPVPAAAAAADDDEHAPAGKCAYF